MTFTFIIKRSVLTKVAKKDYTSSKIYSMAFVGTPIANRRERGLFLLIPKNLLFLHLINV